MVHYINEIVHRYKIEGGDLRKHSFGVLLDSEKSEDFRRWQAEAYQWLQEKIVHKVKGYEDKGYEEVESSEDDFHDWIQAQKQKPFHMQIQDGGTLPSALKTRPINRWNRAKKHITWEETNDNGIPIIELIGDHQQDPSEKPLLGRTLSDSQRTRVKVLFEGVKGANPKTGLIIVEYMVMNGVSFTDTGKIKKSEIVAGLAEEGTKLAKSTVGRYLGTKNKKGFIKQIADELVETLRWRKE